MTILNAIWFGDDGDGHRAALERHFGVRLRPGESSFYGSVLYRWKPAKSRWRWFRRAEPGDISAITLFRNSDMDDEPIVDGYSTDDWVIEIMTSGPAKPVQDFLVMRGRPVER